MTASSNAGRALPSGGSARGRTLPVPELDATRFLVNLGSVSAAEPVPTFPVNDHTTSLARSAITRQGDFPSRFGHPGQPIHQRGKTPAARRSSNARSTFCCGSLPEAAQASGQPSTCPPIPTRTQSWSAELLCRSP